jgi:hypothetical protein
MFIIFTVYMFRITGFLDFVHHTRKNNILETPSFQNIVFFSI